MKIRLLDYGGRCPERAHANDAGARDSNHRQRGYGTTGKPRGLLPGHHAESWMAPRLQYMPNRR